jgi:L-fucose dehydrogenase
VDLQLKDKVILIAGFSKSEVGAAIARACANEGAITVSADISSGAQRPQHAVEQAVEQFGRIEGLITHAEWNDAIGLERTSTEQYASSLHQSLVPHYSVAHGALAHLKTSRGAIVNVISNAQPIDAKCRSGYESMKGAMLALTREWAVELVPYGIRVNAVITAEVSSTHSIATTASAVAFLISEKSGHTTGQHVVIDN